MLLTTYTVHLEFPNLSSIFPLRTLEDSEILVAVLWMFCPQCFCNGLHHKGHDEEYVGMDLVSVPLYARNKLQQLYFVSSIPQLLFGNAAKHLCC